MPVMCPNHALQPLYYTVSTKQYYTVLDVLDSGYIRVEDSVVMDETDSEELECAAGCVISPLEIGAHPGLLIDM
jgi:hypothetical protein